MDETPRRGPVAPPPAESPAERRGDELAAAKARLREAAAALEEELSPAGWVRRHPWRALGLALLAGYLLGQDPAARRRLALLLAEGALAGSRGPFRRGTLARR